MRIMPYTKNTGLGFIFALSVLICPVSGYSQVDDSDSLQKIVNAGRFNEKLSKNNNPSLADTNVLFKRLNLQGIKKTPFISVQQALKGNASGLYVNEGSGDPGADQLMYIRGLSTPLFTKRDVYSSQPIVYVNGVPLSQDNGLQYGIQRYDFNKLGSATNLLANIDLRNIESIEVLKTPADLALLGPLSNNGAIWINTKNAKAGITQFNFETYFGTLQQPDVYETNAAYESAFRKRMYDKYATEQQKTNQPLYISNANDPYYFGAANWSDVYYKAKPIYYVGFGLMGGADRANFLFNASVTKDRNFDATSMDRYNLMFGINMTPVKWLVISSNINATRANRVRNKSLSDRFAETRFVPDLSNPLPPNKQGYQAFLDKYRGSVDDNANTGIIGRVDITATFGGLQVRSLLTYDYEESIRDVFWGRNLMDGNNFASYYFGFNQRFAVRNSAKYDFWVGRHEHKIQTEVGQHYTSDFFKYDYVLAYNTPNDFIKIKQILQNRSGFYENQHNIFAYPFSDNVKLNLVSLYSKLGYSYKEIIQIIGVVRYDGYSNYNVDNRWLLTPVAAARVNLHRITKMPDVINALSLKASWGIFGKLTHDNRFGIGPQYKVDLGYPDEPFIGSYSGLVGLTPPYSSGLLYNFYNWPYSERTNIGMELGLANNRLILGIDYYFYKDKNMVVPVNMSAEKGFDYKYVQGMAISNNGIDVNTVARIIDKKMLVWSMFANFSWNKNKLLQLPYGLKEVVYSNRKIEVGKPIDSYWVYENKGIINNAAEVPKGLTFTGTIPFSSGDPLWKDNNSDGVIDSKDKVLKGHSLPIYTGGAGSNLSYRKIYFDVALFYALGHHLLNNLTANKLDFINADLSRDITNIKEVTFWQKTFDYNNYPVYNPWSSVVPYRDDQDLFLQNADYLKLRYVSLGYDVAAWPVFQKAKFTKALIYITGSNLFTITSFKEGDPELIDYHGIYNGRALPVPKSYIIGIKLNF